MKIVTVATLGLLGWLSPCMSQPINRIEQKIQYKQPLIINGKVETLESYQERPLILELFASNCVVCFQMLPKLEELRKKYQGKMQLLLVGKEDGKIQKIYSRFEMKQNLQLDIAFDSAFFRYISPPFVPTYLWIDGNGKIIAETGPDKITDENIDYFLAENYSSFNSKTKSIEHDTLFHSSLILANAAMGYEYPTLSSTTNLFTTINASVEDLYRYAYFGQRSWNYGDPFYGIVYPFVVSTDSLSNQLFYYSVKTNLSKFTIQQVMQQDLMRYFGYSIEILKAPMPYWSLKARDIISAKSKTTKRSYEKTNAGLRYRNVPVEELIKLLSYHHRSHGVFIDESGITTGIDIDIDALFTDWEDTLKGFREAGWTLEQKTREMLVIRLSGKQVADR